MVLASNLLSRITEMGSNIGKMCIQRSCLEGLAAQEGIGVALQCAQLGLQQGPQSQRGAAAGLAELSHERKSGAAGQYIVCVRQLCLQRLQQTCTEVWAAPGCISALADSLHDYS